MEQHENVSVMKIRDIVKKHENYPRVALDEDTVIRYRGQYELGEHLPPLIVQKESCILIDGFHRLEALKRLGFKDAARALL